MKSNTRWREFGITALIAVSFGVTDAWSHRTPATCPACEFEALRAVTGGTEISDGTDIPDGAEISIHADQEMIRASFGR